MASYRDKLREILSEKEFEFAKSAFDVIGDIAIVEIDDVLKSKQKLMAETLLKLHKNIKVVLKKDSEHHGEFRTQKMKWLAGEKRKTTLHNENYTRLKIDVEKVYFSPRLATERKRIAELVKPGENILVMFSGAAPYPAVLSKNTKARRVVGIEINPEGHRYGEENLKLNKLKNVVLYNGDAKEIVPEIIKKPVIGLKSNWRKEHLAKKLPNKPELLEIYIGRGDLENHFDELYFSVRKLAKRGLPLVLHPPLIYKGMELTPCTDRKDILDNTIECWDLLQKLCKDLGLLGFVGHCYSFPQNMLKKTGLPSYPHKLKYLEDFFSKHHKRYPHLYFENMGWGIYSRPRVIKRIQKKFKLRLCIDVAHLYLASYTEGEFYTSVRELIELDHHVHNADCKYLGLRDILGKEHSCPVGEGRIDFDKVVPFVRQGICEVVNTNELNPKEMVSSWKKLNRIAEDLHKYDRILMPLPKSAEDFLPTAMKAARKGTVIHFYGFLHESEFQKAEEKAKKACKKAGFSYKKLAFTKCGQHSPRTYRVCLDFRVG